jgi:hypothetical protein
MTIKMNMTLTDDFSKSLDQLQKNVEDNILRSSARAGALVFYELMHAYAPYKDGKLLNAIYHKFIPEVERENYKSYRVGVNHKQAPHWHLLEYGHMMYYQAIRKPNGEWVTLVRPDKKGLPKPGRWASRQAKDEYYVPLKGGPKQIPGFGYVRNSYDNGKNMAYNAVINRARQRFNDIYSNPSKVTADVD